MISPRNAEPTSETKRLGFTTNYANTLHGSRFGFND